MINKVKEIWYKPEMDVFDYVLIDSRHLFGKSLLFKQMRPITRGGYFGEAVNLSLYSRSNGDWRVWGSLIFRTFNIMFSEWQNND